MPVRRMAMIEDQDGNHITIHNRHPSVRVPVTSH